MTSTTQTDLSVGVGLVFSLLAMAAAIALAVFGYDYSVSYAAGEAVRHIQINSGIAFGVAMLASSLAIAAIHVYGN